MTILGTIADALARIDQRISPVGSGFGAGSVVPVPLSQPIRLTDNAQGAVLVSHDQVVQSNPVVFGIWAKVVQTLATTDIVVEELQADKRWAVATDTDLERLLREPADDLGLIDLLQWIFNPLYTEGNGLVAQVRDDPAKPPIGLIGLDWRYMQAWARPGGPVELWATFQLPGDPRAVEPKDVCHVAWQPPTAGAIGVAPLVALGTAIRVDDAAGRLLDAQYSNGLHFGGFLAFPKDMTKEQMPSDADIETMKAGWKETYGGIDNAWSVAVLKGGMQFEKVSMTVADAQILGAKDVAALDVYRAFGVRRSDFEDTEGVAVEERNRSLHRSLIPPTVLAAAAINRQIVDREPSWRGRFRVRFDLSDLLRGTFREELETAVYAFTNGMTTRNEGRKSVGLPELDDPESKKTFVPHAQLNPGVDGRTGAPSSQTQPGRETRQIPGPGNPAG